MTRKKKHAGGRPSKGLADTKLLVGMDARLRDIVEACAAAAGVGLAEWLRRAAHAEALRQAAGDAKLARLAE